MKKPKLTASTHMLVLRIPADVHRALLVYAAERRRTMTAVILAALRTRGIK